MGATLFPDLVVNGEVVPHAAVAAEVQNHDAPKGKPGNAWRKAANAVAVRTLLLQEARRRGLSAEPAEVGPGRFETEEEAFSTWRSASHRPTRRRSTPNGRATRPVSARRRYGRCRISFSPATRAMRGRCVRPAPGPMR